MTTELIKLDEREKRQLEAAEADINHGGQLIYAALKRIHDNELYRERHATFDDYCRERWDIGRRRAYYLLSHGKVLANLGFEDEDVCTNGAQSAISGEKSTEIEAPATPPPSERATREIADLKPSDQQKVFAEASKNGQKPTAKRMKAARQKVVKPDKQTSFDVAEIEGTKPAIVKDAIERDVPQHLIEHHARAAEIQSAATKLDQVKKLVKELAEQPGGEFLPAQQIEIALKDIKGLISHSRYWTACPRCAKGSKKCDRCEGHGFMPYSRRGMLSDEDKQALGIE